MIKKLITIHHESKQHWTENEKGEAVTAEVLNFFIRTEKVMPVSTLF